MCQREQKVDMLTKAMPAVSLKKCESCSGIDFKLKKFGLRERFLDS